MKIISRTIPFDKDAVLLLDIFEQEKQLFFLDSGLVRQGDAEASYLGFAPFKTIDADDFNALRAQLKPYLKAAASRYFSCGAVGRMGYDGSLRFALYAGVIRINHRLKTLTITALKGQQGAWDIDDVLTRIKQYRPPASGAHCSGTLVMKHDTHRTQYIASVKKALKHIHDGDIYQINLSHRILARLAYGRGRIVPAHIYKELRSLSPSDFSAYLDDGTQTILSSSPERFLKLSRSTVQVKPMKGTRPRGSSPSEDKKNRRELLESAKEKAELLMVTDLERNDLGRVCEYGSVKVSAMRTIEEYRTVFQATSTVEGRLRKDCDQFDLLASTFPSGSVTGCPKIEAMKIIKDLERSDRGLYTGALGYISFSGDMDFNVLIRTLFVKKNAVSFHVGGGIVADSDPVKEYEETLLKAGAMEASLRKAFDQ